MEPGKGESLHAPMIDSVVLGRLLRQPSLNQMIFLEPFCSAVITDPDGVLLAGDPCNRQGEAEPILVGDTLIGHVEGDRARELAGYLGACAGLNEDNRTLARKSLDKGHDLSTLHQVTERLLSAQDDTEVRACLVDAAMRSLNGDGACLLLLNDQTDSLELVASRGITYHSRSILEVGGDPVGTVLRSGVGEIVNDVHEDPRPVLADGDLRSLVCSPLRSRNRLFGVLVVCSTSAHHFTAAGRQLLDNLAAQGGGVIEVVRLSGALRHGSARPADLIYGLEDRPPPVALVMLAAQHVFIAFMYLAVPVLIGLEGGLAPREIASLVSMSLIAMGLTTLLHVKRRGTLGSGYLAPAITSVIYLPPLLLAVNLGGLPMVFGMTFMIGLFGLLLARVIGRLRRLFPPEVCGVVVLMTGLSLIAVAFPLLFGPQTGGMVDSAALKVGLITLAIMVVATISRVGNVRLYATFVGLLVGYSLSLGFGVIDRSFFDQLLDQAWLGLPRAPSLQLSFSPVLIVPFAIATLAASLKLLGLVTSAQMTNDVHWKRPDMGSIQGGIVADSVGNLASGALGGVGISISAGNIGLSKATGATSRRIGVVVGVMFIALAFVPKLTAAITLMPAPVMGAGLVYTACFLVISGLEMIVSRRLDSRRTFVVGLSIIAGLGLQLIPGVIAQAPPWTAAFLSSPLAFSTTLAVGLHLLMGFWVAHRARIRWSGRVGRDEIVAFLERHASSWGARLDLVHRASPSLVQLCEEVWSHHRGAELGVELVYDELSLSIEVEGRVRSALEMAGLDRMASHLHGRFEGQARLNRKGDAWRVRFVFEN